MIRLFGILIGLGFTAAVLGEDKEIVKGEYAEPVAV